MAIVPPQSRDDYLIAPEPPNPNQVPDRSFGQYLGDTAIKVAESGVGIGRDVTTLGRDAAGEGGYWEAADRAGRMAQDWLGKQVSPTQKAIDTGEAGWTDRPFGHLSSTVAQFAPWVLVGEALGAVGAMAGPAAPVAIPALSAAFWGAMGSAEYRKAVRDIADGPLDKIVQTSKWQELLKNNNGDEKAARNELYAGMRDSWPEALSALAGGALAGPLTRPLHGLTRGRLSGAALGAGEMGGALGAQTGAVAYGAQLAEQRAGIRERIDAAPIIDQSLEAALTGAVAGGVLGAIQRPRRPGEQASPAGAIDVSGGPPAGPLVDPAHAAALREYGWDTGQQPPGSPFGGGEPPAPEVPPPPPPPVPPPAPPRAEGPPAPTTFQMGAFRPRGLEERMPEPVEPIAPEAPTAPAAATGVTQPGNLEERGRVLLEEAQAMQARGEDPTANAEWLSRYQEFTRDNDAATRGEEVAPVAPAAPARPAEIPSAVPTPEVEVTPAGKPGIGPKGEAIRQKGRRRTVEEPPAEVPAADEAETQRREQRLDDLVAERREAQDMGDRERLAEVDREIAKLEAVPAAPVAPVPPVAAAVTLAPVEGKGKATVKRVRAKKEPAPARPAGTLTLGGEQPREPTAIARPEVSEAAPEKSTKLDRRAKFVGRNSDGAAIWELPNGRRQYVTDNDVLVNEARRVKDAPRAKQFEVERQARVFSTPPSPSVAEQKTAFNKRLRENLEKELKSEVGRRDTVQWEKVDPEDIVEGNVPSEDELAKLPSQLSKDAKTMLRRYKDRYWRNWAARGIIEDYGRADRTGANRPSVRGLAEVAADATQPMANRMEALHTLYHEARDLEGQIQHMYTWMGQHLAQDHEPLATFEVGGKARNRSGMWHNYAMRLGAAKRAAERLLRTSGVDVEDMYSQIEHVQNPPNNQRLIERTNDIFKLLQAAQDGETAIKAAEQERRGVNVDITAQRKGQSMTPDREPATMSAEEREAEVNRLIEEGTAEEARGAESDEDTSIVALEEAEAKPGVQRQSEEPTVEAPDEADDDTHYARRQTRGRLDPNLSDDALDQLRQQDPKAAQTIDAVQHHLPYEYEANVAAIENIVSAADHMGDNLPLADVLVKYLKQVIENQKKGYLYGHDVVALPDDRLAKIIKDQPEQVLRKTNAGTIIDELLKDAPKTGNDILRSMFLGRFKHMVEDTPVTILGEKAWRQYVGIFEHNLPAGVFNEKTGHIVLDATALDGHYNQLIGHEIAHAASWRALNRDKPFRDGMNWVLEHVRRDARAKGIDWTDSRTHYGLNDVHELLAEAWNNPDFQDYLGRVHVSREQWRGLGFEEELYGGARNVWRAIVNMVSRALGYGRYGRTALDAVMRLTEHIPTDKPGWDPGGEAIRFARRGTGAMPDETSSSRTMRNRLTDVTSGMTTRRTAFALHSFTDLVRRGEQAFQNVTRPIYETVAQIGETRDRILARHRVNEVMHQLEDYTRRFDRDRRFARFLIDETVHGAYADQPLTHENNRHITGRLEHEQVRLQHDAMMQRYREVVAGNPEAVALRERLHRAARNMGVTEINRRTIFNYFEAMGDAADLAQAKTSRLLRQRPTDEQQALLDAIPRDTLVEQLREAHATPEFRRLVGPYVPLMRHGDHVVRGTYDLGRLVAAHGGISQAEGRSAVFSDANQARAYIADVTRQLGLAQRGTQRIVWDRSRNEPADLGVEQFTDMQTASDPLVGNFELRHQVNFNNEHFETFDRRGDARRRVTQLGNWARQNNHPLQMRGVEHIRDASSGPSALHMSEQLASVVRRVQRSPQFQMLPEYRQADILDSFREAAARANVRSDAAGRFLPRQLTEGASDNLVRNYAEFFQSTANYMARAEHTNELHRTMEAANHYVHENRYGNPPEHELRDAVMKEITRRVSERPQVWSGSVLGHAINRILGLSYLDKLASPGFLAINMSEPIMLGIPMMGGRHGGMQTFRALMRAYNDVGAFGILGRGARDFMRAARGQREFDDWIGYLQGRIADPQEQALIRHLADRGWFNANATQQLEQIYTPNANAFGRAADYADNTFRQINTAVENLNRVVTALAAYRLERRNRDASHEQAQIYAGEKLGEIAGNYSTYNAAPIFNSPLGKLALQFKKYPQRIIGNYFRLAADAARGNPDAMKGVVLAAAMQTLVSGVLGLPTEPLKAIFTAGSLTGVTPSWDTVEHDLRAFMTRRFGPEFSEIINRGVPRYAGVDLGRLGHDSLITFGTPPSSKPTDIKASMFNLIAGAPGGLAFDAMQGVQDIVQANRHFAAGAGEQGRQKLIEAGRGLLPIKTGADIVDAWLRATQSRFTTQPGGAPRQPMYGPADQLIRGLGFTPGWEAEMSEARRWAAAQRQVTQQDRTGIMREWVRATPAERNAVWSSIQEWNEGQPNDQRILRGDLIKAQAREMKQARAPVSDLGVRFSKRDQSLKRDLDVYNLGGQ